MAPFFSVPSKLFVHFFPLCVCVCVCELSSPLLSHNSHTGVVTTACADTYMETHTTRRERKTTVEQGWCQEGEMTAANRMGREMRGITAAAATAATGCTSRGGLLFAGSGFLIPGSKLRDVLKIGSQVAIPGDAGILQLTYETLLTPGLAHVTLRL
mgnify:CR=1 FL=1